MVNLFTIHWYSIAVVKNVLGDQCCGRYDNNFDHNLFDHKILVFRYYCGLWQPYNKHFLKIFEHLKRVFHRKGFEKVKLQSQFFKVFKSTLSCRINGGPTAVFGKNLDLHSL